MSVKKSFNLLLSQLKETEKALDTLQVTSDKAALVQKLKKIKQACNSIQLPTVRVVAKNATNWFDPVIPLSGQSRLNIHSTKCFFDTNGYFKHCLPESWQVTWETGSMKTLVVEYRQREDLANSETNRVLYAEIFDLREALVPIIGSNNVDIDGYYQPMGKYLGPTNVKYQAEDHEADFYGELTTLTEGRHIHITNGVPKVTGEAVIATADPQDFYCSRVYRPTDNSWNEVYEVRVLNDVIAVKVGRMFKDDTKPSENWTQWKKLQFLPDGTMSCVQAKLQHDGSYELFGGKMSEEKKLKYISLVEKLFL